MIRSRSCWLRRDVACWLVAYGRTCECRHAQTHPQTHAQTDTGRTDCLALSVESAFSMFLMLFVCCFLTHLCCYRSAAPPLEASRVSLVEQTEADIMTNITRRRRGRSYTREALGKAPVTGNAPCNNNRDELAASSKVGPHLCTLRCLWTRAVQRSETKKQARWRHPYWPYWHRASFAVIAIPCVVGLVYVCMPTGRV